MAIARDDARGVSPNLAVIQPTFLQAVFVFLTGDVFTVHAVVRAIAVAKVLAVGIHPEGLVGGKLVPLKAAPTLTPENASGTPESKAFITLAALHTSVQAHGPRCQVFTGFRAGHALLKVAVLWAGEGWNTRRKTQG